ncbi:class I SAM-dependent methyltransferase [Rhizosaccharibacter radicis]|uniref:Methyltransferase domain-containing protein n=1 Tax=Rhizosaccharibacter radicis TaxID=2782605 RepID=A0ABT1VZL6_9PROT|nr:methyltransferase domain-containing protein [Acetobacteraceae bacterium KSS12]
MFHSGSIDLHRTFRDRDDESWLDILVSSLRIGEIDGVSMPGFPAEELQREIHGHSGEVSLHEAHAFFREVKSYAAFAGRPIAPHRTLLDFGCGWGRMLRLFMKDIEPARLFGADSTSRFLQEARRCNPAVNFLSCELVPPMILAPESLDYVVSWSVFSHLDEFLASRWVEEFARLLKPGGLLMMTTQSRRFIGFCAEQRLKRASGIRLDHPWHEACADSFVDETLENSRYEAGHFLHAASMQPPHPLSHYGEAIIPRGFVVKRWGHLFRMIEFLDNPVRLPQVLVVLQKPG